MNIFSICIGAVVASILAVLLKKHNAEYSLILTICAASLIGVTLLSELILAINSINDIVAVSKINSDYIIILMKCVGICFLTEFTSDCCKDASQNTLSSVVLMSGRLCTLLASFPLFQDFLNLSLSLAGGEI